MAVAHKLLVIAYNMLKTGEEYKELGEISIITGRQKGIVQGAVRLASVVSDFVERANAQMIRPSVVLR